MSVAADSPPSALLAWLRLFRIPNLFTAWADVAMAFVITQQGIQPLPTFIALLVASSFLYTAGMVLNDVFDVEQDTRERPKRPIPSGQISLGTARIIGFGLLALGVIAGAVAGYLPSNSEVALPWRSGVVAGLLALCVVLYDVVLKRTPVGPMFMGFCRFFNVLLGMSCAGGNFIAETPWTLYFPAGYLLIAAAIGTYVLGITLLARTEAVESNRPALIRAIAIMGFGIAILLLVPPKLVQPVPLQQPWVWPALLIMLTISIGRHAVNAVMDPAPQRVQWAVKFAILSIITLDAAVALIGAGPIYALGIFALVAPMLMLGKVVYST